MRDNALPQKKYWQMDREEFFKALHFMLLRLFMCQEPVEQQIVRAARYGDWSFLAEYLKLGFEITDDEMRKFVIAVLEQEIKKPNNRAASFKTRMREMDVGLFVSEQVKRGKKKERAIEDAERKFGLGRRQIQRDLRAHEQRQNSVDQFTRALSTLLNHGQEKGWLRPGALQVRRYPDGGVRLCHWTASGLALKQYAGLSRSPSVGYTLSLTALEPRGLEQRPIFPR